MEHDEWIWICRWEEFQHYPPERDRPPAWIKDYPKQMLDDRYLQLTDRQRALIRDLRDVFSMTHGRLADDRRMIARRRGVHTRDADLQALNDAGLIEIVSRETLDQRLEKFYASRARPRARREVESSKELSTEKDARAREPAGATRATRSDNSKPPPSPPRGKPSRLSPYQRAEHYVRNAAWHYDLDTFLTELQPFALADDETDRLTELRTQLADDEALNW
jgi:hypothetical protein